MEIFAAMTASDARRMGAMRKVTSRGLATRSRILSCIVDLVATQGYNATNLQLICDASGVAKGSILHQFPTRIDMMQAVSQHCSEMIILHLQNELDKIENRSERILHFSEILWISATDKVGAALAEIQDAAHWDMDLSAFIKPETDRLAEMLFVELKKMSDDAGISDFTTLIHSMLLQIVAMRGLIVGSRLSKSQPDNAIILDKLKTIWRSDVTAQINRSTA